ncbi:MAG: AbiV family abortive infection protein [Acidimicrobiia bacterium]
MRKEFKCIALDDETLSELAVKVRANAVEMITDARLMLDAGRHGRAHALGVLALEEAGKICLCLAGLIGIMTPTEILKSWDSHVDKLTQSHLLALLYADSYPVTTNVVQELDAAVRSDAALRLRGLYVDPTTDGIAGPNEISAEQATRIVLLVEEVRAVLQEMDLHGALKRFRAPDVDAGREAWLKMREDMAAAVSQAEAVPEPERLAAEARMRTGIDDLVRALRSSLADDQINAG